MVIYPTQSYCRIYTCIYMCIIVKEGGTLCWYVPMMLVGTTDLSSVCACYQSVLLSAVYLHLLSPHPLHGGDQWGHSCLLVGQTFPSQTRHSGEPLPISCCNACLWDQKEITKIIKHTEQNLFIIIKFI